MHGQQYIKKWQLCVARYFPTTHTEYPSTTRGMYGDSSVAVNVDFCGYLRFLRLVLSKMYVQYTTEKLSGQQLVLVS